MIQVKSMNHTEEPKLDDVQMMLLTYRDNLEAQHDQYKEEYGKMCSGLDNELKFLETEWYIRYPIGTEWSYLYSTAKWKLFMDGDG